MHFGGVYSLLLHGGSGPGVVLAALFGGRLRIDALLLSVQPVGPSAVHLALAPLPPGRSPRPWLVFLREGPSRLCERPRAFSSPTLGLVGWLRGDGSLRCLMVGGRSPRTRHGDFPRRRLRAVSA